MPCRWLFFAQMLRGKGIYLAFANSKNITTLNLPEIMDEQHSVYYDGCLLYHEPDYVVGTYHVKEDTRLIASGVFSGDNKIYELVLPEGLRCICANAIDYMGGCTQSPSPSRFSSCRTDS